MLICVDGISGVGKTALLTDLAQAAMQFGFATRSLHFFSAAKICARDGEQDPVALERALFHPRTTVSEQAVLFRRLCELACDSFLSSRTSVSEAVTLVDRSPYSYFAYLTGSSNDDFCFWPSFHGAIAALQPVVLTIDVPEALRRTQVGDKRDRRDLIHNLSVGRATAVQQAFVEMAQRFGTPCYPVDLARDQLIAAMRSVSRARDEPRSER